ncbi:GNAT family protein [soil metagenome]
MNHQVVGARVPDWKPAPRLLNPPMRGAYVRLVPLSGVHDVDLFVALGQDTDDDLWTYRPTPRPTTVAQMGEVIGAAMGNPTYVIVPTQGPRASRPAGLASYLRVDPGNGSAEVGAVIFANSLQRTRAATEAIHLMMAHAFEQRYRRLEWKCDALNEPSRRAAVRLGFRFEGRFAQHMVVKGRNRDTDWFAVTDAEWPAVGEAHRAWLAPDNFEPDGRQRVSLSSLTVHIPDARLI